MSNHSTGHPVRALYSSSACPNVAGKYPKVSGETCVRTRQREQKKMGTSTFTAVKTETSVTVTLFTAPLRMQDVERQRLQHAPDDAQAASMESAIARRR